MNPLNIINHIRLEKPNLIKLIISNQTRIKNPNIFRVFEIFLVIAVISRLSYAIQPPIVLVLTLAYECFHTLSLILVSPSFVFVLGNAIVIALFVNYYSPNYNVQGPKSPSNEQRKKMVGEEAIMAAIFAGPADDQAAARFYRRSTSEITARRETVEGGGGLRRAKSNMEITKSPNSKGYCGHCGTGLGGCRKSKVGHYPEDHMSKEEFRKTIEEFIAKQQRVLREEENFSAFE